MQPRVEISLLAVLTVASPFFAYRQAIQPTTTSSPANQKILVVAPESKSDLVVAVPPVTSVRVAIKPDKKSSMDTIDLSSWIAREDAVNGLESARLLAWHIVVTYDQYDEDGDNVHSGVYEEFWGGEKKYKRVYRSDNFNQTDYATDKGLYRQGDQTWPDRVQSQVRAEVISPFYYAATLQGFHEAMVERTFQNYTLQCEFIEKDSGSSDPTQYCFEPNSSVLRYTHGFAWYQTVYNRIEQFQGSNVAREVDVTDGGKPYLKLRVDTLELLPQSINDEGFLPPPNAIGLLGDRISGVQVQMLNSAIPQWPGSLKQQHSVVELEIVIGKDGRVISAHAISGPPEAFNPCEDAARKLIFKPYQVLGKPVEVEQKIAFSYN